MSETIKATAETVGYILTIAAFVVAVWKIWKQMKFISNAQQCLLRSQITEIYYKHSGTAQPTLREYERKNLDDLYEGYKALGGNHYVTDIYNKMREWTVVS